MHIYNYFLSHLLLAPPFNEEDEQRLPCLKFKGFYTAAEAKEKLKQVELEVQTAEAALKAMDQFNPITAAKVHIHLKAMLQIKNMREIEFLSLQSFEACIVYMYICIYTRFHVHLFVCVHDFP